MRVSRRTSIDLMNVFDVRPLEEKLKGQYDDVYITFTTLDNEPDAWEDQGESFLHIPIADVRDATLEKILEYLPMITWTDYKVLAKYVKEKTS